jgi:hypothetical protein
MLPGFCKTLLILFLSFGKYGRGHLGPHRLATHTNFHGFSAFLWLLYFLVCFLLTFCHDSPLLKNIILLLQQ